MARFLIAPIAKKFQQTIRARRKKKALMRLERQKQFRKGFGGDKPKQFDVKAQLPTMGRKKRIVPRRFRRFIPRRLKKRVI